MVTLKYLLKLILKRINHMTAALDRLNLSIAHLSDEVTKLADDIRSHPAAADDSGALNAAADKLDALASSLAGLDTSPVAPAPAVDPAPAPAPADPAAPAAPAPAI